MYLDSAYLAKFYVNEHDSPAVRALIREADTIRSSAWAIGEVTCAFHRHMRAGSLTQEQFRALVGAFEQHIDEALWVLEPVTDGILRRLTAIIRSTPASIYLRAGDAIHLATAQEAGEAEIWSNDSHLLAAAAHFRLAGRSA